MEQAAILSEATIAEYNRQGAVLLRQVLTSEEISSLQQGIDYNMKHPSHLAAIASDDDDPGQFFEDFCNWQRIESYRKIACHSKLPQMAAQLMASEKVRLYHDHVLVKVANTRQSTPWHQDQPYYSIEGSQNVSFWIPVDPVPEESSLQFVPSSHQDGTWYMPRTFKTREAKWFDERSLPDVPEIHTNTKTLVWSLSPGDVVAFHMRTIHKSAGTVAQRRVFSLRYVGDDARIVNRSWTTSPPFPSNSPADMNHPLFPIVYEK